MLKKLSYYFKVGNFYVAAGFNSGGIANAGGAGMALAEWITAGEPTMDLSSVDIRRFAPHHNNKRYLQECVKETLSWHYLLRFPYSERIRARGLRCSPLFSVLDAAGASWGDRMGWEVAKWFSLPGQGTVEVVVQVAVPVTHRKYTSLFTVINCAAREVTENYREQLKFPG